MSPLRMFGFHRQQVVAAAGPAFYPTDLTGKLLLYIMDDAYVQRSGSNVTEVTDLSGNGYNASVGASPPTFNATGLNGHGVVEMTPNSPTPYLTWGTGVDFLDGARGTSVYMVLKHRALGGDNIFLTLKIVGSSNYPCFEIFNGNIDYQFSGDNAKIPEKTRWTNVNPNTTTFRRVCFTYNGAGYNAHTNSKCWVDEVLQTSVASTYQQWGAHNVAGTYQAGAGSGFSCPLDLAFLCIVDHELSSTERANLDAWALAKYFTVAFTPSEEKSAAVSKPKWFIRGPKPGSVQRRNRMVLAFALGAAVAAAAYFVQFVHFGGMP